MTNTIRIVVAGVLASLFAVFSGNAPMWVLATLVVVTFICLTWLLPNKEKPQPPVVPMAFYPLNQPKLAVHVTSRSDIQKAVLPVVTLYLLETPDRFELLEGYGRFFLPRPLRSVKREEPRHLVWSVGLALFAVFCIVLALSLGRTDVSPSLALVALLSVMGSIRSSWYVAHLFWRDPIYRQRNTTFRDMTIKLQREGKQPRQLLNSLPD